VLLYSVIFKNKGKFPQDLCPKLWTWKILPLHVDGQGNRVVVGTRGCLSLLTINILQFFELKIDILEKTLCHSKQTDHLKWITWSMSTTVMIGFHCRHDRKRLRGTRFYAQCQSKSCPLLHKCTNKLYSKSTTGRSNGLPMCSKQP